MSTIDEIISKIQALPISGGDLTLTAADFTGSDFMQGYFSNVLRAASITLTGATRNASATSITVTGQSGLLGYASMGLALDFSEQGDQVVATVSGTFDPGKTTALPVLTWIKVGDVTLTATLTETFSIVTFGFGLNVITPDGTKIPVSLMQMPGNDWRLAIADGTSQGIALTEWVSLLNGQALLSFLPQNLVSTLDAVELNGIETIYNTDAKAVSYFTAAVHFAKGWDIAPKVSLLPGLQITLTLLNANDSATRQSIANVMGTLMIGSVNVPLQVGTSVGGTTVWSFGIQVGQKVTLPSLSALLDLADASDALPDGLSGIPAIDINDFLINFDSTRSVLTELDFSIATASTWPIIAGYFEIEQLSIDFRISDVNIPASRLVLGSLYGLFKVGDTEIFCSLAKTVQNPDWTITAGLPPDAKLNITTLFKSLLEPQIIIPNGTPTLDFTTLLITVVPDKNTFAFSAGSTDTWALIPGKLSILGFQIDFKRDPAGGAQSITGSIASSLLIVSVTIDLSASLNATPLGGWQFVGSTKEGDTLPIGQFLTYITQTFSIPAPPEWMQSITLKNLGVTLNTVTNDFTFQITADATISGKPCELLLHFSLAHSAKGYALALDGTLTVGGQTFTLDFTKTGTDTLLGATWKSAPGQSLSLQDLAALFGDATVTSLMGDIPSDMDLALTSLSFTYDFTHSELVLTAVSKNYGSLVFVAAKPTTEWVYSFLVAIGKFDLTHLPLIGEEVGQLGPFEIDDFNLLICSGKIAADEITRINGFIAAAAKTTGATLPSLPEGTAGLQRGVNLSMIFQVAGYSAPVAVGTATPASGTGTQTLRSAAPDLASSPPESRKAISSTTTLVATGASTTSGDNLQTQNGFWINLQKAFGPVYMDKIGFAYTDGDLVISFNFSLKLGELTLTLDGLSAGSPLTTFAPVFGLQGLGLTFNSGAVEISGGFIRQEVNGVTEYNGQALIKTGTFALSAMGSYAKVDGETSLFIFAMVLTPFGGPPYFFITGLAAGFGYNRSLTLPGIDQVATFPLVSGFVPGQGSPFSGNDPNEALQVLVTQNVVPIAVGENWLAAGIQFTSFEMLQSFALVSVEFGSHLEIALLGLTTASIPTGDPRPLLFAQLALEVRILPDDGLVAVEAKLISNSYLLDSSCHLTGGFAFYIWFGNNPHAGDFVVTLGGYHPAFNKPDYYPDVPRLGFNWVVTSELTIKGGMYFALTPICLMAGGSLQALWQSGNLKCWFDVGADFLIMWKPYHYQIDVYLSFGVSYTFRINLLFTHVTVTISVSLGADLSIWGPAFSGVAHIHLWIVSFTVRFGASSSQTPPPIPWNDFEQSFFPAAADSPRQQTRMRRKLSAPLTQLQQAPPTPVTSFQIWNLSAPQGLIQNVAQGPSNPDDMDWIVSPQGTLLQAQSIIPAKKYTLIIQGMGSDGKPVPVDSSQIIITNEAELADRNISFGVGPSGIEQDDFTSEITLTLSYWDGLISSKQLFSITALIQSAPKALWIQGAPDISNSETLVPKVLVGFQITAGQMPPDETPWADIDLLGFNDYLYQPDISWSNPESVIGPDQPADPINQLEVTLLIAPSRTGIIASLLANDADINPNIDVQSMAKFAGDVLLAPPVFAYEYALPD
jgi:hypothetical protein